MATIKERIARLEGQRNQGQPIDGVFVHEYDLTPDEIRAEYERQFPGESYDDVIWVEPKP